MSRLVVKKNRKAIQSIYIHFVFDLPLLAWLDNVLMTHKHNLRLYRFSSTTTYVHNPGRDRESVWHGSYQAEKVTKRKPVADEAKQIHQLLHTVLY
jgi:hypothetical protein